MRGIAVFAGILAAAGPAAACPVCDTETGRRVRAGVFDGHFAGNLVATLAPFPVLLGVAAAIHFGPPRRGGRGPESTP